MGRREKGWDVFPPHRMPTAAFPLPPAGTPTEDTWPGITSNEEFKAYNFSQYRAQPLINHAPRYPRSPGVPQEQEDGGVGGV